MSAGSAVLYLGSTLHAGGTNNSEEWRRGIHLSYCLGHNPSDMPDDERF